MSIPQGFTTVASEDVMLRTDVDGLLVPDVEVADGMENRSNDPRREKRRGFAVALVGSVTLLMGIAAFVHGGKAFSSRSLDDVSKEYSVVAKAQPGWQIFTKERDLCSNDKDNCFTTQCCNVAGHKCFMTSTYFAKCMKFCKIGKDSSDCTQLETHAGMDVELSGSGQKPASTMLCFSVYTKNTGSPTKSYEKELLTRQHAEKVSIFACDAFSVYGDVAVSLGGDLTTIQVDDVEGDFHCCKRKKKDGTGGWINTGMFKQVWKKIGNAGEYKKYDWTIKADPDAVFVPARLKTRILMMPRPKVGVYLVTCKNVEYGFFGNLEVFSSMAFGILVANIDKCNADLPWKVGLKGGKFGPVGEDLFAEMCMEKNGVAKAEAFDITVDGACEANRPYDMAKNKHWRAKCGDVTSAAAMHPFKKTHDYFECLAETTKAA
jgi:predicted lipoprotein with Yx(FWY)xxD motif